MTVRTALKNIDAELPLDSQPETRLDFDLARQAAQSGYDRPFLRSTTSVLRRHVVVIESW